MTAKKISKLKFSIAIVVIAALVVGFTPQFLGAQSVSELQQQIDSLNSEIEQGQSQIDDLRDQRDSLENRLKILDAEADQLQQKINLTEQEMQRTEDEINRLEDELERTKELIQANVKVLYKQGSPSTLEMLFSSENFTDFVNRQEYLDKVKSSLNEAARESVVLKEDMEDKEEELNVKHRELEGQRRQLTSKQEEQRQLIAQTRGREEEYKKLVETRQEEVEELRAQQAAIMAEAAADRGGPDYSGYSEYPWPDISMAYDDSCEYFNGSGSAADPWGYCKRQCTSYVAWKLHKDGRSGYTYLGHAKSWKSGGTAIGNFRHAQTGDVLVWDVGNYGHVMYVESKTSNGLYISQFNVPYDSGVYSTDFYSWSELNNGVGGYGFYLRRF